MIESSYAKAILNILMAKPVNSTAGENDPALEERAKLKKDGVKLYVDPKKTYTDEEREYKNKINASKYWNTKEITLKISEDTTYYGYKTVRKDLTSSKCYPTSRYLALLTNMPNPDGSDFGEFRIINDTEDGQTTYCKRIDLNKGFFSGGLIMSEAKQNTTKIDSENPDFGIEGGAMTLNNVVIYFPEITEQDWEGDADNGPVLVGFGIFSNKEAISGEKPYLWGALNNTDVTAKLNHVPLFRKNNFQFSIK